VAPETIIPIIAAAFLILLLGGGAAIAASSKPEVLGHPKGLYMLFFAELW
jgi:proton-dependent oligopeptide transporter, POT family